MNDTDEQPSADVSALSSEMSTSMSDGLRTLSAAWASIFRQVKENTERLRESGLMADSEGTTDDE